MKANVLISSALALGATFGLISSASAAAQQFYAVSNVTAVTPADARDAFLLATTGVQAEGFESAAVGVPPCATGLSILGGTGTLTQSRFDTGNVVQEGGATTFGRFNTTQGPCNVTATCKWWDTAYSFEIALSSPKSAFAFFAMDVGDLGGSITMDFWNNTTQVRSGVALTQPTLTAGLLFFGYIDDTFTFDRIVVNVNQTNTDPTFFDGIGFDDILVGQRNPTGPGPGPNPVSAPGSIALVTLGLGLMAATRVRRKSAAAPR